MRPTLRPAWTPVSHVAALSAPLSWVAHAFTKAVVLLAFAWFIAAPALAQQAGNKAPQIPDGASPQLSEGTIRGQFGDWQVVCKPPPTGARNEVCALVQSVTAEDRPNVGLTIYFQKFSSGVRVLRVFAPLGILLPPGIGLTIDEAQIGKAPFLRCHSFACYAQVTVDDDIVSKLSTGRTAIFVIYQTEEAGIGIPISLAGFNEALAQLK